MKCGYQEEMISAGYAVCVSASRDEGLTVAGFWDFHVLHCWSF